MSLAKSGICRVRTIYFLSFGIGKSKSEELGLDAVDGIEDDATVVDDNENGIETDPTGNDIFTTLI
jgi:hypothetical protein